MGRHFSDCTHPSWRCFATVRRWYLVLPYTAEVTVYEHFTCRGCGALWTQAWLVDSVEVGA